jgi:hypothetical protein
MGLDRMFVGGLVIAFRMVLGCCVVSLCCMLVMLRCLPVCVRCHRSFGETSSLAPETLLWLHAGKHLHHVKISRRFCLCNVSLHHLPGRLVQQCLDNGCILLSPPIHSVMSFLSTTGGVVPVDSDPERG